MGERRQPSQIIHVYIKVECALQLMLNEIPITTTNFNERYLAADPAHTCLLPLCHPFSFGAVCHYGSEKVIRERFLDSGIVWQLGGATAKFVVKVSAFSQMSSAQTTRRTSILMMAATVSTSLARNQAFIQRIVLPSRASRGLPSRAASRGLHTGRNWRSVRRSANDNLFRLHSTEPSAEDDYSSLTVSQLRAELKERKLPVSGIKATLIDRLSRSVARESSSLPANLAFSSESSDIVDGGSDPNQTVGTPPLEEPVSERKTFKEDFLGTRVFVQGLSQRTTWKELKDHFQIAGSVVFASVSIDRQTGRSKKHGIVQFETPEEAKEAIKVMRKHPLDGEKLYVREDVQESRKGSRVINVENRYDKEVPNEWKRANDEEDDESGEDWYRLNDNELKEIEGLIRKRDTQRRQRNYKMSDKIREQLKLDFGVHLDDRVG